MTGCKHEWIEITAIGDDKHKYISIKCGKEKEGEDVISYVNGDPNSDSDNLSSGL